MNYYSVLLIVVVFANFYECAIIHESEEIPNDRNKITREETLLATASLDHNAQFNPDAIADHQKPLDNLVEAQDGSLEQTVKEKRCKLDENGIVGLPPILSLRRRDTTSTILRRSCDNCLNSLMCKTKGKCDGCKKICERYEAYLEQPVEEIQMDDGSTQNRDQSDLVGVQNRINDPVKNQGGLSYGENRYYTVGSFAPGPVQALLAKLLNIKEAEPIAQLVILAKTKSPQPTKPVRPVVIDTAHVFSLNRGGPSKLDVEIHEVRGGAGNVDSIASELDKEIEKAMKEKQKTSGTTHLAPSEIDNIILRAMRENPKRPKMPHLSTRNNNEDDGHDGLQNQKDTEEIEEWQSPQKHRIQQNTPSAAENNKFERIVAQNQTPEERRGGSNIPSSEMQAPTGWQQRAPPFENEQEQRQYIKQGQEHTQTEDREDKREEGEKLKQQEQDKIKSTTEGIIRSPETTPSGQQILATKPTHWSQVPSRSNDEDSAELGQEYPFHPDSDIKTTIPLPKTKGPKPGNIKGADRKDQVPKSVHKKQASEHAQEALHQYNPSIEEKGEAPSGQQILTTKEKDWSQVPSRSNEDSVELGQEYPFHPDSDIKTTTPLPKTKGPKPGNIKGADRKDQVPKSVHKKQASEHAQEALHQYNPSIEEKGEAPSGQQILTTKEEDWSQVPSRSNEDSVELGQEYPFHPDSDIKTTTPLPKTKGPKPGNIKGADRKDQVPKSVHKKQASEHAQEALHQYNPSIEEKGEAPSGQQILTTKEKDWSHVLSRSNDEDSPELGQENPFHPDSDIKTTTPLPKTKGPKPGNIKGADRKDQVPKSVHKKQALEHAQEALHQYNPSVEENGKTARDQFKQEESFNQPPPPETPPINARNLDNSDRGMMEEIDFDNQPIDDDQVYTHYVVGKKQDTMDKPTDVRFPNNKAVITQMADPMLSRESYEDKYNQLRQWIMENSPVPPPELRGNTGNRLAEEVKDIITTASKINKQISNIVKTDAKNSDLVEMVKENDEKLRALDEDRNEHIIGIPNMNQFKTRISPETQRKIDDIFSNEEQLGSQRMNKDPYDSHPRKISEYDNGKWVYNKIRPNRPPYSTKHRAMNPEDSRQAIDNIPSDDGTRIPTPTYIDPKLLNMDSVVKSLEETPRMYYDKTNKKIGVNAERRIPHQNQNEPFTSPPKENKRSETKIDTPINSESRASTEDDSKEKNETVACSKEEEEEMLEVLHLHPIMSGGYRSSEHTGSNDRPSVHPKRISPTHKSESKSPNDKIEDSMKQVAIQTQEMIDSLNKKHKHGKTAEHGEMQNIQENREQFIPPINMNRGYFPPISNFDQSMRAIPDIQEDPNFMEEPIMFNKPNMMQQDIIGSPLMQNGIQEAYRDDLNHMGKFIPRHKERTLSLHSRDVSEQEKIKSMYFIGDGIKLPLNMKEHDDGSLHLSVDVKSLCNCKHCTGRQLENGTIILEAMPMTEEERQEHEQEIQLMEASENTEQESKHSGHEKDDLIIEDEENTMDVSKRSRRTKKSLEDNEVDPGLSIISEEEISIPMKNLTKQEILSRLTGNKEVEKQLDKNSDQHETDNSNDKNRNSEENPRIKLFTNVLDFMKKIAFDIQSKK